MNIKSAMGAIFSKRQLSDEDLAIHIRKQNSKILRRIHKIIHSAYIRGYLKDFEFYTTVGYYQGMKTRHLIGEDEIFIAGMDHLNDMVCGLIQERYSKEKEQHELMECLTDPDSPKVKEKKPKNRKNQPSTSQQDKNAEACLKMLQASPYYNLGK